MTTMLFFCKVVNHKTATAFEVHTQFKILIRGCMCTKTSENFIKMKKNVF